eukprot:CAMPEP_0176410086 /NCGR_PEP_ID=MMETSP0127-20121128/2860_1 /TAXON_ID=938130 /ORGANISM="Platyophrya macrostoma, Strain WH" /LENGTH=268 /DNA_ID=CAMNT_0017789541 /DNA_START=41 /DNA_END=847 /DNA_ORIENTATION=-
MDVVKNTLGKVKEDAEKLLAPQPKVALRPNLSVGIPRPRAPVQSPTADDLRLAKQSNIQQDIQKHSELVSDSMDKLRNDGLPPTERAKQLWGVVRGMTGKVTSTAASKTTQVVHEANYKLDQKAFLDEFGSIVGSGGVLLHRFSAQIVHDGTPISVTLYVTATHLCVEGGPVKDFLPLGAIASMVPCVALPTVEGSRYFVAVPDPRVKPTALQVYTTQRHVWEITAIRHTVRHVATDMHLDAFQLLYVELDRAWRAAVTVPLTNVTYS